MRLIDADALIEKWYEVNDIGPEDRGAIFIGYTEIPRFINNAPTVETTGDYISRADAINAVVNMQDGSGQTYEFVREVMFALKALPSADAVPQSEQYKKGFEDCKRAYEIELARSADAVSRKDTVTLNSPISIQAEMVAVVRCKDCKHAYYADNRVPHEKTWVCERFMNEEITSNDFCSWGERRDINP